MMLVGSGPPIHYSPWYLMRLTRTAELYTVNMRWLSALVVALGLPAAGATDIRSSLLVINVDPACSVSIVSSRVNLESNGVSSGEILFRYSVRTSRSGGGGSIKLSSGDSGRTITLSSQVSGAGTAAPGAQSFVSGDSIVVVTFPANAHSREGGETGSISWTAAGVAAPLWSLTAECR